MDSMRKRFQRNIIGNIGSYDLTEEQMSLFRKRLRDDNDLTDEQISFLKNKSVVNDKEGEMMEVGEEDENNLAIGRDETGIDE